MAQPPLADEIAAEAVRVYEDNGKDQTKAAEALGIARSTFQNRLKRAAERGLMGTAPVLPGFRLGKTTAVYDANGTVVREFVQQVPEAGERFEAPDGMRLKKLSVLTDGEDRIKLKWHKLDEDHEARLAVMRAAVSAFKEEIPRISPTVAPAHVNTDLLNQYVVTDLHFGMLSWREETGSDYDLKLAEQLLLDWFSAAIAMSPAAHTGLFAQLGDLMHHDALESVTPAHRHVLDADSRLQKVIRVVIRVIRQIIGMLLQKHQHVHLVMASGNHDPASSAWLREMLAAMYEHEPRISVDNSPALYYAYEWGRTALFYHHGHKRNVNNVDTVFAGMFREIYGRCIKAYAHVGHFHSDEGKRTNLMNVERHETLAAPDAYAAGGGWLSDRSAKVITYTKNGGEVFRSTLSPEMVAGAHKAYANDNWTDVGDYKVRTFHGG
jgi:DNA-binding Lrp family transcriptional regulator